MPILQTNQKEEVDLICLFHPNSPLLKRQKSWARTGEMWSFCRPTGLARRAKLERYFNCTSSNHFRTPKMIYLEIGTGCSHGTSFLLIFLAESKTAFGILLCRSWAANDKLCSMECLFMSPGSLVGVQLSSIVKHPVCAGVGWILGETPLKRARDTIESGGCE